MTTETSTQKRPPATAIDGVLRSTNPDSGFIDPMKDPINALVDHVYLQARRDAEEARFGDEPLSIFVALQSAIGQLCEEQRIVLPPEAHAVVMAEMADEQGAGE